MNQLRTIAVTVNDDPCFLVAYDPAVVTPGRVADEVKRIGDRLAEEQGEYLSRYTLRAALIREVPGVSDYTADRWILYRSAAHVAQSAESQVRLLAE